MKKGGGTSLAKARAWRKVYDKIYKVKNKDRLAAQQKVWKINNVDRIRKAANARHKRKYRVDAAYTKAIREKWRNYQLKYSKDISKRRKAAKHAYYLKNKEHILAATKQYQLTNKEKCAIRNHRYYIKHKEDYAIRGSTYKRDKTKMQLRRRLSHKKLNKGIYNTKSTVRFLGCSIKFFKEYIAAKFKPGMSWNNHGKWHLDHIKPCSSFDLDNPIEQQSCFHYTNLQPLWAKDNLKKHTKLDCQGE